MADIIMGIDKNSVSSDKKTQQSIKKKLEKAGHKVKLLNVGPNYTQTEMGKASSKGKVAIYLVNGADVGTYKDFAVGIKQGYYHVKHAYFGLQGWISPKTCSCKGAKTVKLQKAWDDNYSSKGFTSNVVGKTTEEVCNMYPQIDYACGSSVEELGNNLVKVIGGGTNSNVTKKVGEGGTIKDALQKLLTYWDGQVECYIRGNEVHVNRIRNPSEYYSGVLVEGVNVFADSITVTDVNPNTCNYLEVIWTGGVVTIKDDNLIERFGLNKTSVMATKTIKLDTSKSKTTGAGPADDWDTTPSHTGRRRIEQILGDNNNDDGGTGTGSTTSKSSTTTDSTSSSKKDSDKEKKVSTMNVDIIKTYKEALLYAEMMWNKLQRDNGRSLECQVWGSCKWKVGEWYLVYLPSFYIDGYMYATAVSQGNDSGDWVATLTLVDYPPGWGKYEEPEEPEDDEEDEDEDEDDDSKSES